MVAPGKLEVRELPRPETGPDQLLLNKESLDLVRRIADGIDITGSDGVMKVVIEP